MYVSMVGIYYYSLIWMPLYAYPSIHLCFVEVAQEILFHNFM